MKAYIIKAFLLGGVLVGATSCEDFLDQTSLSEHTEENIFSSPYYVNLELNKVYGEMTEDETYSNLMGFTVTANTDCELIDASKSATSNTFYDNSERGAMNYNAQADGWSKLPTAWQKMYVGIEYCNRLVENVDKYIGNVSSSNAKLLRRYRAEAKTLRAMFYYDLVKNFGDVPFKLEATKSDLSNIYNGKTDRDVILDSLMNDLNDAIDALPWVGENSYTTEHVTKGYAHALYAQLALQRAGWAIREKDKSAEGYITATDGNSDPTYPTQRCSDADREKYYKIALEHLSAVVASGKHQLNPSFENEWYLVNQRTLDTQYHENVFEIGMTLSKSGERGYTIGVRINGSSDRYGQKGNSSGKIKTTAPYFMSFKDGDTRRDITCAPYQLKSTNSGKNIQEDFDSNTPFGIFIGKWDIRKMSEEWRQAAIATTDKCPTGINEIKMRYSYLLLLYAEALNELNGPDDATGGAGLTARQALAEVHTRAFDNAHKSEATAYINAIQGKDALFNAIVQENAWELCGEGYRKYDLERWNLLSQKIDEFKQTYQQELEDGVYPKNLYYKTVTDTEGNVTIDMSSVCWKVSDEPSNTTGYKSQKWWGTEATASTKKNLEMILPEISAGLNSTVKNRYLLPIPATSISNSNHAYENSYGF